MFELSPEKLLTKFGKSTFLIGRCLTLPDLKSLVIASNTPKNLMLEYFNKKILENEDKREVMRKEARNEAEKWDWNQATLQLQNYYSDTLQKIDKP